MHKKKKTPAKGVPEQLTPKQATAQHLTDADVQPLMQMYLHNHEHQASQELQAIAGDIADLRVTLLTGSGDSLPEAGAELEAVLRDTEQATHIILDASEALLNLPADHPDLKAATDELVMRIFEACSFQDIVGQRINKIIRLMQSIEARVGITDDIAAPENKDPLLNGPGLNGPQVSQCAVDGMFI